MIRRLRDPRGNALVTSLLVMFLFVTLGFATMALVDTQQRESGRERVRESSFALSEGVLNSQIYLLSRQWPGLAAQAYTGQCSVSTSANLRCPDNATLQTGFTGNDYGAGMDWTTEIRDNTSDAANYYEDAVVRQQPQWDSNRDGYLWVRAQGLVRGKRRTIVALVKAEDLTLQFPRNAVVAGKITVGPNGNQTYIATSGSYVTLRCTATSLNNPACRGWGRDVHVGPNAQINVSANQPPALGPEKLERLRETAKSNGTYYASGCPDLAGSIVFIEVANCTYTGNDTWNSQASPGVLVLGSGELELGGRTMYYGVIYNANGSDGTGTASSGFIVRTQGNACVYGTVVIDGNGGLQIGASNGANRCIGNVQFDANVANNLKAFGTAGLVQNSFREITTSS